MSCTSVYKLVQCRSLHCRWLGYVKGHVYSNKPAENTDDGKPNSHSSHSSYMYIVPLDPSLVVDLQNCTVCIQWVTLEAVTNQTHDRVDTRSLRREVLRVASCCSCTRTRADRSFTRMLEVNLLTITSGLIICDSRRHTWHCIDSWQRVNGCHRQKL